ncbi:MAG: NAD(P)H-hydrate dehydratase [Desulfobacteraceae bacterium]|nr:NAD(P)H-hydrate dehydratase [Desulfobacteraceae bacterium]
MFSNSSRVVYSSVMPEIDHKTIFEFGLSGEVLMENAGRGCVRVLTENINHLREKKILVVCGPGNNGGDGFVIARYLAKKTADLKIVLLYSSKKLQGDALLNYERAKKINIPIIEETRQFTEKLKNEVKNSDIIIDAIFGTGLRSAPEGLFGETIDFINNSKKYIMAIDIPSGTNGDTGETLGRSVNADLCATFGFAKPAHYIEPGRKNRGTLFVIDIGIPHTVSDEFEENINILTKEYVKTILKKRDANSHKGSFGHLGIIAGSKNKAGAAILCSKSAHRSGAGLVTLCSPCDSFSVSGFEETMRFPVSSDNGEFFENSVDEVREFIKDKTAIAAGPGMGTGKGAQKIIEFLIKNSNIPLLIDADGLNIISEKRELLDYLDKRIILTPHPKEMSRLTNIPTEEILNDQIKSAREFALKYKCILVLKTSSSIIAFPDGKIKINTSGNPGLAAGGSGDILSGIAGAFLANKMSIENAAEAAVFIHGYSADITSLQKGPFGYLPSETADNIPIVFKELLENDH